MLRLFFRLAMLVLFFDDCYAQPEKVEAKIIAGIMGAQIDGDRLAGYDKPGGILGMGMELKLGKRFSVQPEIMYCQKGARSNSKSPYYAVVRLNYIDMIAALNFYLNEKIVLQPGVSYGLLYKARIDNGGGFVASNDFFKESDLCYIAALEYKFTSRIAFNIRYDYSIRSISPYQPWFNNTLSFTLRFTISNE